MNILVINPGSSSIKFSMYGDGLHLLYEGELSGVGGEAELEFRDAAHVDLASRMGEVRAATVEEAIATVERAVSLEGLPQAEAVGYRVVHPGPRLCGHQRVTPEVMEELRAGKPFAPLHDPEAVQIIEETMVRFPSVPHFACFDTVFHETMPEEAKVYALPPEVRAEGVRRYGFHGLSCESIVTQMREAGVLPARMAIAHLGSGSSVTACVDGKSVDTTMGLTPTGGVVMGTRSGDLDPGVIFYLLRREGATVDSVEQMVNHDAGLKGLGGVNDMRALRELIAKGDPRARFAVRVFCRSVARALAGFVALDGVEAVVFTGGIGEHDAATREEVAELLGGLGMAMDTAANRVESSGLRRVSAEGARIAAWVAPAEEDRMIARHVAKMLMV
jgi:acetate kinase